MGYSKQGEHSYRFECMIKGKRFFKTYVTYDKSKKELQKNFLLWKISCEKHNYVSTTYTFGDFAEIWIKEYCKDYRYQVVKHYESNLNNWILPWFGKYKLNEITPLVLDGFISQLKSSTTKYKNRKNEQLSVGSIKKIYSITHTIINTAYQKGLIDKNPCNRVKLDFKKVIEEKTLHCWDIDTYRKAMFLLEQDTSPNAKVIEFALKTGLRRSEIFGLTWSDVDMVRKIISINKTLQKNKDGMEELPCKTTSSIRVISIPSSLVSMLTIYKEKYHNERYVFENIDYDAVTAWFRKWETKNDLPKIRFHDLRHTHASLLLAKNIDIKTISERLGHSDIGTTMNIYTHVMKELDEKASKAIDEIA